MNDYASFIMHTATLRNIFKELSTFTGAKADAFNNMNLEQIKVLTGKGESATIEFKKSTASLRAAFETVCAFLNVKGGVVLIGVDDKGQSEVLCGY